MCNRWQDQPRKNRLGCILDQIWPSKSCIKLIVQEIAYYQKLIPNSQISRDEFRVWRNFANFDLPFEFQRYLSWLIDRKLDFCQKYKKCDSSSFDSHICNSWRMLESEFISKKNIFLIIIHYQQHRNLGKNLEKSQYQ